MVAAAATLGVILLAVCLTVIGRQIALVRRESQAAYRALRIDLDTAMQSTRRAGFLAESAIHTAQRAEERAVAATCAPIVDIWPPPKT